MKDKREQYVCKIGPLLRSILDRQKENITKQTYDVCDSSDWEAGEILAKKLIESRLI